MSSGLSMSFPASKGRWAWLWVFSLLFLGALPAAAQIGPDLYPDILVYPRHAGRPDPRWRVFDWKYVDRTAAEIPYRFHFYGEEQWAARFVLPLVESQIHELKTLFGFAPSERINYILFTSLEHFRNANIFFVREGVQGVTSTEEATMALPYTGDVKEFSHVSLHEMVHQFQTRKIHSGAGDDADQIMEKIPLWFIEGMAEYDSLRGVDAEADAYIRDLIAHPDPEKKHEMIDFFATGIPNFVFTYKLGQVKIAFLESQGGAGTARTVLDLMIKENDHLGFAGAVDRALAERASAFGAASKWRLADGAEPGTKERIANLESAWRAWLKERYDEQLSRLPQRLDEAAQRVPEAGENADFFDVSPNGETLALREIDPLAGLTRIVLMDLKSGSEHKTRVARDQRGKVAGLYFFAGPTLALTDRLIAYFYETPQGPVLQVRTYSRAKSEYAFGRSFEKSFQETGLLRALSPAFSPDGRRLAFVGLGADGQQGVYVMPVGPDGELDQEPRRILSGPWTWRSLSWAETPGGPRRGSSALRLVASSNRFKPNVFSVCSIDVENGSVRLVTSSEHDQLEPVSDGQGGLLFRSDRSGTPQIHHLFKGRERRLTGVSTMASLPRLRGEVLYFLALRSGRFHLHRLKPSEFLHEAQPPQSAIESRTPWQPDLAAIEPAQIRAYEPFRTSGVRLEQLRGFISGGVAGLRASASDLMRDYQVSSTLISPDNADDSVAQLRFASQKGRATWALGVFRIVQPRLDNGDFQEESDVESRYYRHREWGASGSYSYPLSIFSSIGVGARLASVERDAYSDPELADEWERRAAGSDVLISPSLWYGFDRVLYEPYSGPIGGFSFLLEAGTSHYTERGQSNQRARLDIASYWQLFSSRTVLALEGIVGASGGDTFREPFLLWSDDILRAYAYGDRRLLGNYIAAAKAELRFPVGSGFGWPGLRGVVALDYGAVARDRSRLGDTIASSASWGASLSLPPLVLEALLSDPFEVASGGTDDRVLHIRLTYLYQ